MRCVLLVLCVGIPCLGCSSDDKAGSNAASTGAGSSTDAGATATATATSGSGGADGTTSAATSTTNGSAATDGTASTDATTSGSTSTDGDTTSGGGGGLTGAGGSSTTTGTAGGTGGGGSSELGFFVSSDTSATGNLGGLAGADARCQLLAEAVGAGDRTWRAYLSADSDPDSGDMPVNARDRIGAGPWTNAAGVVLANDLDELHSLSGDHELFLDENAQPINGQWEGSPSPNQHDILTGSDADGNLMAGSTCDSWTSESSSLAAQIGHSDGLGPNQNGDPPYNSWNSSHENGGCDDTAPLGGAGRVYCFAAD